MNAKIFAIISLILSFLKVESQNDIVFEFSSYPSFNEGFKLVVNKRLESVEIVTYNNFYASDSLSNDSFQIMEEERFQKIKEFVPRSNVYSKNISTDKMNQIVFYLESLTSYKKDAYPPGLDGITFRVLGNQGERRKYWSPRKNTEVGKTILLLIQELSSIFNDTIDVIKRLNDTRRYIYIPQLEILSEELPYLKLYYFRSCKEFKSQIEVLKKSEEVFIDITEYEGRGVECIKDELYKKFKHIRWIQNEMFDEFNSVGENKK